MVEKVSPYYQVSSPHGYRQRQWVQPSPDRYKNRYKYKYVSLLVQGLGSCSTPWPRFEGRVPYPPAPTCCEAGRTRRLVMGWGPGPGLTHRMIRNPRCLAAFRQICLYFDKY